jgi:predicted dehydrogenase
MAAGRRIAVWLEPAQCGLVRDVAAAAGVGIAIAGSPARGHSHGVASELGSEPSDDLRAILASADVDLVWIASPGPFGVGGGSGDAEAVLAAHARGVKVAASEPVPASALDLFSGLWLDAGIAMRPADIVRFIPAPRGSLAMRHADDVLANFGEIRSIAVETWSSRAEGSLGARIFEGLALIASLLGEPEKIDAAYAAPTHGTGVHGLPGESLRDLSGDICACMRFADGRAASLVASDQGGRWNRTITILGPAGRLRIFDDGLEWIGPTGQRTDEMRPPHLRGDAPVSHAVSAIAESLTRMLDPAAPDPAPLDHATILSMAQAILLSARTGEAESPGTIKRMVGAA